MYASEVVTGWQQGAPADMPDGQTVWHADVDFLPRCAWIVDGEEAVRLSSLPDL